ncbi:ATP-binding protein [Sulfolobus sp. S-194]|uniref:ATP-binding protein n=1 Tax=Sulfolobus sp. S-194 TaxID=2512240 RepID=UPI001436D044|nr:ATP-binding protein [Sulfolobus sp. S-194]QIW23245.1 ATP-binding protein [Sulfolobus sp. S-194]
MRSYIIFLSVLILETIILYFIDITQNSLYSISITALVVIINGIMAFILFNSVLLSIISLPSFFSIYSIINRLNFYEMLLLISYYSEYYLIVTLVAFFIYSFVKRNFYDFLIDELKKVKFSFSLLKFIIGISLSLVLYWVLFFNPIFLVGSLLDSLAISLYGFYYELPLITFNWITLPYLIFPKTYKPPNKGVLIGKIIGKIGKGSSLDNAFYTSNSTYKWIRTDGIYYLDFNSSKNYNVIIIGTSGVGKSTLAKRIVNSLNVSYLVFDLHGEYEVQRAKKIDASKVTINPLSLFGRSPKERALEISLMVKSLFNLGNLQTIELTNLIIEAYAEKGIDENDSSTWNLSPPTFRDILILLEKKKKLATTSQDIIKYQSIEPYIQFLTSSIFNNSNVNISEILENNLIIDFSKIPTNEIKYILIETLLKSIQNTMYISGISNLKKIIIIDEAPFILSKESGKQILERLFAEGRKFGFGFIIISQTSEYIKELLANTSYFFIFNLVEPKELDYASKLFGGSDAQLYATIYETLQKLPRGYCVTRDLLRGEIYLLNLT